MDIRRRGPNARYVIAQNVARLGTRSNPLIRGTRKLPNWDARIDENLGLWAGLFTGVTLYCLEYVERIRSENPN